MKNDFTKLWACSFFAGNRFLKKGIFFCVLFFLLAAQSIAQTIITGTVVDASSGEPLPGVNILIKGKGTGATTDLEGMYRLGEVSSSDVLLFSFIGFISKEVPVGNQTAINVSLEPDVAKLDEVVVVGYGSMEKKDLTGSVGSVDTDMLAERGSTSPMEALQGQVAGVQINTNTGRIGGGFYINIRGVNTLSKSSNPLFVVDGVPTDNIDFLNPLDIARIDILKDASSTAIYGSRGTNGVVIVTTKQASKVAGSATIGYSAYYGVKDVARLPKMMTGDRWWEYRQDARLAGFSDMSTVTLEEVQAAAGLNPWVQEIIDNSNYTDWYDEVLKNGSQQNHHLSISGSASNGLSYVLGLGYQNEEGLIDKEWIDKYSASLNVAHKLSEQWTAGMNINFTHTDLQMGSNTAMQDAFRLSPIAQARDYRGDLIPQPGKYIDPVTGEQYLDFTSTWNPLLEIANASDETRTNNVLGSTFLEFKPIEEVSLKTSLSLGASDSRRGQAWGVLTNKGSDNGKQPLAIVENQENLNYTWDNQANYIKSFGNHSLNLMGLFSMYSTRSEFSLVDVQNLPFASDIYNLGSAGTINRVASGFTKATLMSYVLRANYTFLDKYLVTLSNRWDGSSKLSEGNKWNAFPSAAVGWRLNQESFLKNSATISDMKLRVSYGFTGNNNVAPYSTQSYADQLIYYDFLGVTANGFKPSQLANSLLTWERSRELNVGLDYGFFFNRITGSVDVYDKLSKELLMVQKLPYESGWASMQANVGSVSNKGIELMLNTVNVETANFSWESTFTFTRNINKIVEIYGGKDDDVGNAWFIGQPVNVHYNYKYAGVWQADEAAEAAEYGFEEGNAKVVDFGERGYSADEDRVILGSPLPDWIGSFSTSIKYKNIDFGLNMFSNQGVMVFSHFHDNFADVRSRGRQKLDLNYYVPQNSATSPDGPKATNEYPQPRNEGSFFTDYNVPFYKDASFVKVKNITLGYTFAPSALENLRMKNFRIYANVLNPFVFTSYEGYDPEWGGAELGDGGVAFITYQFGLNVQF